MAKSGSKRPVYISFDEWSAGGPGAGNSLAGSLLVAEHLNSFIRHADIVKMANITMLSSLVGHLPQGDFKNALYQAFYLYSNHSHGTALDVFVGSGKYANKIFTNIPYLDATAVLNNSSNTLVVNVVNRNDTDDQASDILLQSGEFSGTATVSEINSIQSAPANASTAVSVETTSKEIQVQGSKLNYRFPAHSFTQIRIPIK